ncbi:hypothetical protein EJB05_55019 [Eragrostis curvula]|uniref:Uncharacterized protein n=1 Tax=Eragrostis curvula TaxID=38414 RepID=A0A5J9SKS0_9POAL|nr:hypothetical protein EJB05_55019 [Eragrostis curvula]
MQRQPGLCRLLFNLLQSLQVPAETHTVARDHPSPQKKQRNLNHGLPAHPVLRLRLRSVMMLGQLGAVVPRMMTLTEVYLWVLVTSCCVIFGTIDLLFGRQPRLQRVLPAEYFAFFRAKSKSLIKNTTLSALEATVLLQTSPGSILRRRFVYVSVAWTTWSLCFFVALLELALLALNNYQYRAAVHRTIRTVVGAAVLYAFASAAWGPDA